MFHHVATDQNEIILNEIYWGQFVAGFRKIGGQTTATGEVKQKLAVPKNKKEEKKDRKKERKRKKEDAGVGSDDDDIHGPLRWLNDLNNSQKMGYDYFLAYIFHTLFTERSS